MKVISKGNAVINYGDEEVLYTRISEHKHFAPWEQHEKQFVIVNLAVYVVKMIFRITRFV